MSSSEIVQANKDEDYVTGKILFEEYAAALKVDLCFQNFTQELANLTTIYAPPQGCLLLARTNQEWSGCVAIRQQRATICEMKRLYVKPQYRGLGLGRWLADSALRSAQKLGYSEIVLDTLPSMIEAQSLYASLGFREVEGYYPNPVQGVCYLARDLSSPI